MEFNAIIDSTSLLQYVTKCVTVVSYNTKLHRSSCTYRKEHRNILMVGTMSNNFLNKVYSRTSIKQHICNHLLNVKFIRTSAVG